MSDETTPQPVVVQSMCSVCGLEWDRHIMEVRPGPDGEPVEVGPSLMECIRLLKERVNQLAAYREAVQPSTPWVPVPNAPWPSNPYDLYPPPTRIWSYGRQA